LIEIGLKVTKQTSNVINFLKQKGKGKGVPMLKYHAMKRY